MLHASQANPGDPILRQKSRGLSTQYQHQYCTVFVLLYRKQVIFKYQVSGKAVRISHCIACCVRLSTSIVLKSQYHSFECHSVCIQGASNALSGFGQCIRNTKCNKNNVKFYTFRAKLLETISAFILEKGNLCSRSTSHVLQKHFGTPCIACKI